MSTIVQEVELERDRLNAQVARLQAQNTTLLAQVRELEAEIDQACNDCASCLDPTRFLPAYRIERGQPSLEGRVTTTGWVHDWKQRGGGRSFCDASAIRERRFQRQQVGK